LIGFLRGQLINHDTPPKPIAIQSNPVAPVWFSRGSSSQTGHDHNVSPMKNKGRFDGHERQLTSRMIRTPHARSANCSDLRPIEPYVIVVAVDEPCEFVAERPAGILA